MQLLPMQAHAPMYLANRLPGPSSRLPLAGIKNLKSFVRDPLHFFSELQDLGRNRGMPCVAFDLGPNLFRKKSRVYLSIEPGFTAAVLKREQKDIWDKRTEVMGIVARFLGEGVLGMSTEHATGRRDLLKPVYQSKVNKAAESALVQIIDQTLAQWAQASAAHPLNLAAECRVLSLRLFCQSAFGHDVAPWADTLIQAMDGLHTLIAKHINFPFFRDFRWERRHKAERAAYRQSIETCIKAFVAEAERLGRPRPLYHNLAAVLGEDTPDLLDEICNQLFGGLDTTANVLTGLLYEETQMVETYTALRSTVGDEAEFAQLKRAHVQEAMRLHPPAALFSRVAEIKTVLNGIEFPAGSQILISPLVHHYDRKMWAAPEAFIPARFLPAEKGQEEAHKRMLQAYLPFGLGARACLGAQPAFSNVSLVLERLALQGYPRLVEDHQFHPTLGLTRGSKQLMGYFQKV